MQLLRDKNDDNNNNASHDDEMNDKYKVSTWDEMWYGEMSEEI